MLIGNWLRGGLSAEKLKRTSGSFHDAATGVDVILDLHHTEVPDDYFASSNMAISHADDSSEVSIPPAQKGTSGPTPPDSL